MNERIRDLALDAIVKNAAADLWVFTDAELEKFAESIVKECANIIQAEKDTGLYNDQQMAGMSVSKAVINDHFGVE